MRRLPENVFPSIKFIERKLPGKGCGHTKLVSFKDAIELIMVLPGKLAQETRAQFANIIQRYLAGDASLVSEIAMNGQSNAPLPRMARGQHPFTNKEEDEESARKRVKRENLKLIEYEEDVRSKRMHNIDSFMNMMTRIKPDWMQADSRLRLHTEDMIKNVFSVPALLPAGPGNTSYSATLTISQLASELGCQKLTHGDLCKIGALAAKRWRETHPNMDIPAHPQWVDGAERMVKSYTVEDRNLLAQVFYDLGYASRT